MQIIQFQNSNFPLGLFRLNNGQKFVALRLAFLPVYTKPKYSIDQIQDSGQ